MQKYSRDLYIFLDFVYTKRKYYTNGISSFVLSCYFFRNERTTFSRMTMHYCMCTMQFGDVIPQISNLFGTILHRIFELSCTWLRHRHWNSKTVKSYYTNILSRTGPSCDDGTVSEVNCRCRTCDGMRASENDFSCGFFTPWKCTGTGSANLTHRNIRYCYNSILV